MQKVNSFVSVIIWGFAYAPEYTLHHLQLHTNTYVVVRISTELV